MRGFLILATLFLTLILLLLPADIFSLKITNDITIYSYDAKTSTATTCAGLGYDFFDSTSLSCKNCPSNQTSDSSLIDGGGNSGGCQCGIGYFRTDNTIPCSTTDRSGPCLSYNCTSCLSHQLATYSDRSGCAGCDSKTTLGLSHLTGDCLCPTSYALVEKDLVGNYLANKTCQACPSGTQIITTSQTIAGQAYTGSKYLCQSCPDKHMTMQYTNNVYSCRCAVGYTTVGVSAIAPQACIYTPLLAAYASTATAAASMVYRDVGITLTSQVITHYYLRAMAECAYLRHPYSTIYKSSCQILANLCVLQTYASKSIICTNYQQLITLSSSGYSSNTYNITNWMVSMPWITYPISTFHGHKICNQPIYQSTMSLTSTRLYFILASYSLNGTFLGFTPLDTLFTTYCTQFVPDTSTNTQDTAYSTYWMLYGSNEYTSYTCDLRSILSRSTNNQANLQNQHFYELFLYDPNTLTTSNTRQYTPIPIRILNIRRYPDDSERFMSYNTANGQCDNHDILVRRFYLIDIVSGISDPMSSPQVIRYASRIKLEVYRTPNTIANIYPPVLTIEYSESNVNQWSTLDNTRTTPSTTTTSTSTTTTTTTVTNSKVSITFEMTYTMNLHPIQKIFTAFCIAYLILTIIIFGIRYYNWNLRNSRVIQSAQLTTDLGGVNIGNMIQIIIMALNTYVQMAFPLLVLISWYFFVFYKLQSVPSVLLPRSSYELMSNIRSPYYLFYINLYCMTFFQCIYVLLVLVYQQSSNDLYFLDWEPVKSDISMGYQQLSKGMSAAPTPMKRPPRSGNLGTPSNLDTQREKNENLSQQDRDHEQGTDEHQGLLASTGISSYHPPLHTLENHQVSIWRTLLIANEFIALQTLRRSNIVFTLFWLGFVLLGMDLQYNATPQPDLNNLTPNELNVILRFANTTFFWLIFSTAQYLWKFMIYERYFTEPPEQLFIDYCTIAKISLLVLDEKYHGYYLHCRSPYPYADCNMFELIQNLTREELGLTIDRSLDGAPLDVQSFELFLSSEWQQEYTKLLSQLLATQSLDHILESRRMQRSSYFGNNNDNNANNNNNANNGFPNRYNRGGMNSGIGGIGGGMGGMGGMGGGGGNIWNIHHRNRYHRLKSSTFFTPNNPNNTNTNNNNNHHFQYNRFSPTTTNPTTTTTTNIHNNHTNNNPSHTKGLKLGYVFYTQVSPEQIFIIWKEMILFCKEFIENNYQKSYLRRIIHEPNYLERMLHTPPDLSSPNQPSVLYTDRFHEFTSVIFLGQEYNLLLYNILIYSILDYWLNNTMIAMLICYLCDWMIVKLRHSLGQANISKKTIIDGRFLVTMT